MSRTAASRAGGAGPPTDGPRDRQAILAATLDALGEHGYARMTVEGVATRAGVHKATLYRWWASKGSLVGWALGAGLSTGPVADTGSTRDDLVTWLRGTIDNYTSTPAESALPALLSDLASEPGTLEGFRRSFLDARRANCAATVTRGIERGDIPADVDVGLVMDVLAGTVFYRQLVSGEPMDAALAERLVDLVLTGQIPRVA
ncbi:MAG: TetR/AcrR family transcriptional regulator [Modestobacter sp.]|jgi:AcrR family transcriptional regulator|nr:TetR/AcrR family transcriptional regulator [Modestobacter sp.]